MSQSRSRPKGQVDEPSVRLGVRAAGELDEQRLMPDVAGHALELERLEAGPSEQRFVRARELAQVLRDVLGG